MSITKLLLERGADVAATDFDLNRISLEWTVIQANEDLVRLLLQHETFNAAQEDMVIYLARLYDAIWIENDKVIIELLGARIWKAFQRCCYSLYLQRAITKIQQQAGFHIRRVLCGRINAR